MKHMTCINHKQASQVCINPDCEAKCAYLCLQHDDSCRTQHQSCPLASISYLNRKSYKIVGKAHDIHIQKLINMFNNAKKVMDNIDNFLQAYHLLSSIKDILDPHGLLQPKQKQTISQFLHSKLKHDRQVSIPILDRDLSNLSVQLSNYLLVLQEQRKNNEGREDRSRKKSHIKSKVVAPSAVKSGLRDIDDIPGISSKIKQKKESNIKDKKQSHIKEKKQSHIKQRRQPRMVQESPAKVESSSLRRQLPKPPFFSKITNDVQTINHLFYHKFSDVKLLFRASQNQFSVAKFHQKCDDITNTMTIVLTDADKIIGGFTPLPWKPDGGEWYPDHSQATFIFNLTSGERYPLVNKEKAIWCSRAFGPSFGYPDLQIADKAFHNSNSCANFPQCFNNGNYTLSAGSTQMFCGTKSGHFKIKQWEVYELMF